MISYAADTLPKLYAQLVPEYKSRTFRPLIATVAKWERKYGQEIAQINPKRANSRIENYLDRRELQRVLSAGREDFTIRFGVSKSGRGYHGLRGDFCLGSAAVYSKRHLTLFYRSLELIGGLAYDIVLVNQLAAELGTTWKSVTFMAARAHVFALKRNSNEKLYPKLRSIFYDGSEIV